MDREQDLGSVARTIIDTNDYLTLGTADAAGRPWVSPLWYASVGYTEFYWVSSPEARHSRNLVARSEVGLVIFDSRTPVGEGQGVFASAVAEELAGADLDRSIVLFSHASRDRGAGTWDLQEVRPPAAYRLYRATASEHWVLDPAGHPDRRTPVSI